MSLQLIWWGVTAHRDGWMQRTARHPPRPRRVPPMPHRLLPGLSGVPVATIRAATGLSRAYCPDIVEQGVESVSALAAHLLDSPLWYFWWD
jgi:hypothetical protein